ncbi:MAG: hemin uptake protein HemP [Polaromonas sp.]
MSTARPSNTLSFSTHSADARALPEATSSPHGARTPRSCLDSTEILRGQKKVAITHNGTTYCLQATRLGKLILTK